LKISLKILAFIAIGSGFLFAQGAKDTLSFLKSNYYFPLLSSHFNKELSTFNSVEKLKYFTSTNNFFFGFQEVYNTTLVKSNVNHIKDEQNFNALAEYNLNRVIGAGIFISNNIYSDDRKISINTASVNYFSFFTKLNLKNYLKFIPFGGYAYNKQIGEKNEGYIYGAELITPSLHYSNFSFKVLAKIKNEEIDPRKNLLRNILLTLKNRFNESSRNILVVHYSKKRKDFYFETDSLTGNYFNIRHNIQSRTETNYIVSDRISFNEPNTNLNFQFYAGINWRDIDRSTRYILLSNLSASTFDSDIREQKLNFGGEISYLTNKFKGFIRLNYYDRTELHSPKNISGANPIFYQTRDRLEKEKNNRSKQITLTFSANWQINNGNNLNFNLLQRKLSYDTPSPLNFDDRDELLTIFQILYEKRLSPVLDLQFSLEGSFNHIVYIYAERSANNNIQRIVKFSSACNLHTERIKTSASAEVSSNYTVYDFEEQNPAFKSFDFRQFTVKDTTEISIKNNVAFVAQGFLKISEQGDFSWKGFKSKPFRYLTEIYLVPEFVYRCGRLKFGSGIRYYALNTYSFLNNYLKKKIKSYISIAPLGEITVSLKRRLNFKLVGWLEFIRYEDNTKRQLANLKINMQWNF